ncbi:hypothetical protein SDJN03_21269, partial [Cucurbita argyrosperma subsp. sororia]
MVDLVHFKKQRLNHVVSNELKSWIPKMVHHVFLPSGEEIVHHYHTVASLNQTVHEVRPHEPGPACHYDPEPLSLQPQWDLTSGVHDPVDLESSSVLVRWRIGPPGKVGWDRVVSVSVSVADPGRGIGRGEEGEGKSSYTNADEDEEEALFAKHVVDRTGHGQPWLWGFWGICVRRRLGLVVPSEYQLRSHFFISIPIGGSRNGTGYMGFSLITAAATSEVGLPGMEGPRRRR